MGSTLTTLECSSCGATYSADVWHSVCPNCGKILYARYDLAAAARTLTPRELTRRPFTLWRYHEVLPVRDPANMITLYEGGTPLIPVSRIGTTIGLPNLLAKDEGRNPTSSFKARGLCVAMSRARELGATAVAIPSTGNAASAFAAYAARAGLEAHVFVSSKIPTVMRTECLAYGAALHVVDGELDEVGRICREQALQHGWFDISTLHEPYRVEGKKTMGYELVEQLDWHVPDVLLYPTGGGTGIVGIWKAFDELEVMGLIGSQRPRFVSVQASGCAPVVRAVEEGSRWARRWQNPDTIVGGLRAPATIGDYLILRVIEESHGTAITVTDDEMLDMAREVAQREGLFVSLESAATYAAAKKLSHARVLHPNEQIVLLNTAAGIKHADLLAAHRFVS